MNDKMLKRLAKIESEINKMEAPEVAKYLQKNYPDAVKLLRSDEYVDDSYCEAFLDEQAAIVCKKKSDSEDVN